MASYHQSKTKMWRIAELMGLGFLGLILVACGDGEKDGSDVDDGPQDVASQPVSEVEKTVPEVRYPEFERQERIIRISGLDVDPALGATAFQICTQCHGEEGFGSRDGKIPRLAGQHREVIAKRLVEIGAGIRIRPEMEAYSEVIKTDEQIAALSAHISNLPDPQEVAIGPGIDLESGATFFQDLCVSCHGGEGAGNGAAGIPRIGGWDYESVRRTLVLMSDPNSEIHETGMSDLVSMVTADEIDVIADYVSRLTVEASDTP